MITIFFTAGAIATPSEIEVAGKIDVTVLMRNAEWVNAASGVETCDAVAGAVPQIYIDYFKKPEGYFVDAPSDGITYGRLDKGWSEVTSGGGYIETIMNMYGTENFPYELSSEYLPFSNFQASPGSFFKARNIVEIRVLVPLELTFNRKLRVGTSTITDTDSDKVYYNYDIQLINQQGSNEVRLFNNSTIDNSSIAAFLDTVPDPSIPQNDYDSEDLRSVSLSAGTYRLMFELDVQNRTEFEATMQFNLSGTGGNGGFILLSDIINVRNVTNS